jgi:flagellar hook assembly protein FlgD
MKFRVLVPTDGWLTTSVYDVSGRLVRNLVDRTVHTGSHEFIWDGNRSDGLRVAPGVYLVRGQLEGRDPGMGGFEGRVLILR